MKMTLFCKRMQFYSTQTAAPVRLLNETTPFLSEASTAPDPYRSAIPGHCFHCYYDSLSSSLSLKDVLDRPYQLNLSYCIEKMQSPQILIQLPCWLQNVVGRRDKYG